MGVETIGYGHTHQPGERPLPHAITQAQADEYLQDDLTNASCEVSDTIYALMTQNEFDACVDLVFNIGLGHFHKTELVYLINKERYDDASAHFIRFDLAKGRVIPALQARRQCETNIFLRGDYHIVEE